MGAAFCVRISCVMGCLSRLLAAMGVFLVWPIVLTVQGAFISGGLADGGASGEGLGGIFCSGDWGFTVRSGLSGGVVA